MSEKTGTTCTLLQLRLKLRVSPHAFLAKSREAANIIASVDGLIWKIWGLQEEESEIGSIYLFASREATEAFMKHPVIQAVCSNPAVVFAKSELWEVESSLLALTRGPVPDIYAQYSEADALMAGGR